jgi:hypothetical protein
MAIYGALLLLPLLWWGASQKGSRAADIAMLAIFAFLALFVGLRFQVGGDWDSYLLLHLRAEHYDLDVALALSDPAYQFASRMLAKAGLGIGALNLLCACLFFAGLGLFCRAQPRPALALLIAIPVMIVLVAMGFTRQSSALGLLMLALGLWSTRPAVATLLILFAPLWHWSAVLFLPLVLVMQFPRGLPLWRAPVAGALMAGAAIGIAMLPGYSDYLAGSGVARGALVRLAPNFFALGLLFMVWHRLNLSVPARNALWYWAAVSSMLLPIVFVMPTVADRIGMFALVGQVAVFARLPDAAPFARYPRLAMLAFAAPGLTLFAAWLAFSPYQVCWSPYKSYLTAPSALLMAEANRQFRESRACADLQRPVKQ